MLNIIYRMIDGLSLSIISLLVLLGGLGAVKRNTTQNQQVPQCGALDATVQQANIVELDEIHKRLEAIESKLK